MSLGTETRHEPDVKLTKLDSESDLEELGGTRYRLDLPIAIGESTSKAILAELSRTSEGRSPSVREARRSVFSEVASEDDERITWLEQHGMQRFNQVIKNIGDQAAEFIVLRSDVGTLRSALEQT